MSRIESFEFPLEPDDDWPPVSSECIPLLVSPTGYVVMHPPLFVGDISVGDVLEIAVDDGMSPIAGWSHVSRSGNSTIWLANLVRGDKSLWQISKSLQGVGCEVGEALALGMCAVNVPSTVPIKLVDEILSQPSEIVAVAFPSMRHDAHRSG